MPAKRDPEDGTLGEHVEPFSKDGKRYILRVWGQEKDSKPPWYWSLMTTEKEVVLGGGDLPDRETAVYFGQAHAKSAGYQSLDSREDKMFEGVIEQRAKVASLYRKWNRLSSLSSSDFDVKRVNFTKLDMDIQKAEIELARLEKAHGSWK